MTDVVYTRNFSPDMTLDSPPESRVTLHTMAEMILDMVQRCFNQLGIIPPERSLIYLAPIPVDCEQLSVLYSGWTPQPEWDGLQACRNFRWCGNFSVVISRKTCAVPGKGGIVAAEKMTEAARIASEDAEVLIELVNNLGEIGSDFALAISAPQGGYQSTVLEVVVPAFGGLD